MEVLSTWLKQAFIQLIAKQTGLEIKEHDQAALCEKIYLRMQAFKFTIPELYYQLLASETVESVQEWQNLIALITNPESFFFRDKGQFALLRNQILPELIQKNQSHKTLRICSAGCSTGEEPYSLAILLKELIPDLEQWNLVILGVDLSAASLEKAKAGIYRSWSLRGLDPAIQRKYFRLENAQYYLDDRIKQMVTFQLANLVDDSRFQLNSDLKEMDLIICRNVFIYFDTSTIAKVLQKFCQILQPSGYLLTGHTELHAQDSNQFKTNVFSESVIYQRTANSLITPHAPFLSEPSHTLSLEPPSLEAHDPKLEKATETNHLKMQQAALTLLKQLPADTKIPRLNNQTAAELILHLETNLNSTDSSTL